jgi:hypothetical protein
MFVLDHLAWKVQNFHPSIGCEALSKAIHGPSGLMRVAVVLIGGEIEIEMVPSCSFVFHHVPQCSIQPLD